MWHDLLTSVLIGLLLVEKFRDRRHMAWQRKLIDTLQDELDELVGGRGES